MAYIKTDTTKLIEHGNNINKLIEQYDAIVEELFDKIDKANKDNGAISSTSGDEYIEFIMSKKEDYIKLRKELKKYSNSLISYANDLELCGKGDE